MRERLENQKACEKIDEWEIMESEGVGRQEVVRVRVSSQISGQLPIPLDQHCSSHIFLALLGFQGSMDPVPVIWPKIPYSSQPRPPESPADPGLLAWDLEWWSRSSVDPSLFCLILPLPPFLPPALLLPPPAILKCPLIWSESRSQIIFCLFCKW